MQTISNRMKSTQACFFLCAGIMVTISENVAFGTTPQTTAKDAKSYATLWLDGLGQKGLVISEESRIDRKGKQPPVGFKLSHGKGALGPVTKLTYQKKGWWVTLAFHGTFNESTSLETMQKNFWFATLDQLPTPGLDVPGWKIKPQTPRSSFKDGVKLLKFGQGEINVSIKTEFFALYGRDPGILVPADAPAPANSYFQIRKKFPLDLTLSAPLLETD